MTQSLEQDITELQMRVMEQQQAIETMSEQIIVQRAQLSELKIKLASLESKCIQIAEQTELAKSDSVLLDEHPPHY